jgi:hypothetical protein
MGIKIAERIAELPMENILAIILVAFIVVVCSFVAVGNLVYRLRKRKKLIRGIEELESLKRQGDITEEQFQSLKSRAHRRQEPPVESCTLSAEEMMEAIDAALNPVSELERDKNYTGNKKWAEAFGIHADLNLSLKELALLSMKVAKPRKAIDLMAEVLTMNIPIDVLEAAQSQGKTAWGKSPVPLFPRYEAMARMIWVQTRKRLSEPISARKELYEQRKVTAQSLLAELIPVIMKTLDIPTAASGFAAILALMVAKIEFNAFSDENEAD